MFADLRYKVMKSTEGSLDAFSKAIENVSNVNSVGYKKRETSFIETLNGELARYESKDFSQGPLRSTGENFDVAIDGVGFFEVELSNGQRAYTRAGRFQLTSEGELVTEEGYRVIPQIEQSTNKISNKSEKNELDVNIKINSSKLTISPQVVPEISEDGTVNGINPASGEKTKIGKINVVAFNNPQGLESVGRGYYLPTKASGPVQEIEVGLMATSRVRQGFLEYGNVDIASEFMNLTSMKNMLSAQFKLLKIIDKIYENVHFTIGRAV